MSMLDLPPGPSLMESVAKPHRKRRRGRVCTRPDLQVTGIELVEISERDEYQRQKSLLPTVGHRKNGRKKKQISSTSPLCIYIQSVTKQTNARVTQSINRCGIP